MAKKIKEQVQPFTWSYAPALESKDHIQLKQQYELFINGRFVKPNSGKYFDTINPSTEQVIAESQELFKSAQENLL